MIFEPSVVLSSPRGCLRGLNQNNQNQLCTHLTSSPLGSVVQFAYPRCNCRKCGMHCEDVETTFLVLDNRRLEWKSSYPTASICDAALRTLPNQTPVSGPRILRDHGGTMRPVTHLPCKSVFRESKYPSSAKETPWRI
jgi:hypothetical protein